MSNTSSTLPPVPQSAKGYARYLLTMAGLGGLLYGVDVGIIAAALPYIEQTSTYTQLELSQVVAAVLFGSVISSLFAGILADIFGRRPIVALSALLFTLSIPVICFSDNNFLVLMLGRILQGASGGLLGVVVPLYLAECLGADSRGKGTGMFQFLLTVGLVFAAVIGLVTTSHVETVEAAATTTPEILNATKVQAWKIIFWVSALPGIVLFFGAFRLSESPRWLFRRGRTEDALASLTRNNGPERAQLIFDEMHKLEEDEKAAKKAQKEAGAPKDTIFQRKYIYPFILAVVILACNQATGINSVLNYSVKILQQAGLQGIMSNYGDTILKVVNCIMTVVAVALVDKKGRKFLLKLGTSGIIVGLLGVGTLFLSVENNRVDVTDKVAQFVNKGDTLNKIDQSLKLDLENGEVQTALGFATGVDLSQKQLIISYSQGSGTELAVQDFAPTKKGEKVIAPVLTIDQKVDTNKLNDNKEPYAPMELVIEKAQLGDKPTPLIGWGVAICFIIFIAFFASGPGVCVWLALSELMPTRIRSNGMAIALLINQGVSTVIAGSFLPWVNAWGYSGVFYTLAGCTVIYFITAAFFLPETKGRTLEEIEEYFTTGKMPQDKQEFDKIEQEKA